SCASHAVAPEFRWIYGTWDWTETCCGFAGRMSAEDIKERQARVIPKSEFPRPYFYRHRVVEPFPPHSIKFDRDGVVELYVWDSLKLADRSSIGYERSSPIEPPAIVVLRYSSDGPWFRVLEKLDADTMVLEVRDPPIEVKPCCDSLSEHTYVRRRAPKVDQP